MTKALCLVLLSLGLAACGGKSSNATSNPKVPTVGDGGEPLPPPPDSNNNNPNLPPNNSGSTQN